MAEERTRILVVDDEAPIRALLTEILARVGYETVAAADAGRALDILDQDHIDLVLLDLHMPGPADGEDLVYLLRDRGEDVPIIIVSGYVDDDTAAHHPECVHAVIKKPIRIEPFLETVRQVIALS